MHYKTITTSELINMDWKKVIAKTTGSSDETKNWIVIEWEITIQHLSIYILHNNMNAKGSKPDDMKWYSCSRIIWFTIETSKELKDYIEWLKTIEEFTEGEEVYCSDDSIEHAIQSGRKSRYVCTIKSWMHITQYGINYERQDDYWFMWFKYIVKVPKEEVIEMTMEQVNKALGRKIKIVE